MSVEFDIEGRLREHLRRVRAEARQPRALESNILLALDASSSGEPRQRLRYQVAATLAIVALAIGGGLLWPFLRNAPQPGGIAGPIKPLAVPCHLPWWVPEPIAFVTRCRPEAPVKQLDLLRLQKTGVGSAVIDSVKLLDGRYTVFIDQDPSQCVRSFQLVDPQSRGVQETWQFEPGLSGGQRVPFVPLVQEVLPEGDYRLAIGTEGTNCAWMVQIVLNSLLFEAKGWSFGSGPPAYPLPPTITFRKGEASTFSVTQIGFYSANWTMTPDTCRYSVDLQAPDGRRVHRGDGSPGRVRVNNLPAFIGVGSWAVIVTGDCDWTVNVYPYTGDLGGGARGFVP